MKEIKLIALDMDGTLLNSEREIPLENVEILRRVSEEKGIHLSFVSGRMASAMTAFEKQLETDCYFIGWNGACVIDKTSGVTQDPPSTTISSSAYTIFPSLSAQTLQSYEDHLRKLSSRRMMFHLPLPLDAFHQILDIVKLRDIQVNVYLSNHIFVVDLPQHRNYLELYAKRTRTYFSLLKDFQELNMKIQELGSPTKLLLICETEEERDRLHDEFLPQFSDQLNLVKTDHLEFVHKDVNKANGLARLCSELGISLENVVAFGDGENDLEMLAEVGMGICMANGHPRAKSAATKISLWTNDQSAVAKELNLLLFNDKD